MNLEDKNILITGGSSGIGRQIALTCSNMGANIMLLGRNEREMEITRTLCLTPSRVSCVNYDLSATEFPRHGMFEDFIAGGIHGLVHSAGISIICPLRTHDVRFVIESLQVNLISAMELIRKLECNFYRDSSVVIVSSVMSVVGQAAKLSYCSSKGAIDAAVRSLAIELAPKMIRVNSVLPGVVDTPLSRLLFTKLPETNKNDLLIKHPLGLGNPIDVSAAVCFLLSADSTHITGSNITIDGGYTAS